MVTGVSLPLDDVLEDAPQTRCLLKLFESDSVKLGEYMQSMQTVLDRLVMAQSEVTTAMAALGSLLGSYKDQNFPLEHENTDYEAVVEKFQCTITELSSWMEIVSQQLQNCVSYPVNKFLREMNELNARKCVFHSIAEELDGSIVKQAKLSRKDSAKKIDDTNEEFCSTRRQFHLAGLHYYVSMNKLQCTRRISLLEPILSVLYAFRSFCHVGHQSFTKDNDLVGFFTRTQEQLQILHGEQEAETKKYNQLIKTVNEIERLNPAIYNVEHESPADGNPVEISKSAMCYQKQGYLFVKNKSTLLTKWERLYFFIQAGNLMSQTRDELAGKLAMELGPGVKGAVNDSEDRRHTFSVICFKTKNQLVLQAQNNKERDEWVAILNFLTNEVDNTVDTQTQKLDILTKSKKSTSIGVIEDEKVDQIELPIQFDLLTTSEEDGFCASFEPDKIPPSAFSCSVKFLGSLEVAADRDDKAVEEAVKKILETRTNHRITRSLDVNFVVQILSSSPPHLLLVEQKDQRKAELLASFRLDDLALWVVNPGQPQSVALVVRTKRGRADGRHKFTCYLFDALEKEMAEKICTQLTESTRTAFQALVTPPGKVNKPDVKGQGSRHELSHIVQSTVETTDEKRLSQAIENYEKSSETLPAEESLEEKRDEFLG